MKRWTLRILILLILGVVTTVGVAWAVAACVTRIGNQESLGSEDFNVLIGAWHNPGCDFYFVHCLRTDEKGLTLVDERTPAWVDYDANFVRVDGRYDLDKAWAAAGCPMRALVCEYALDQSYHFIHNVAGFGLDGEVRIGHFAIADRVLPLRPTLPGFIINTTFYAALWFVLIFGWRAHLRLVRRWQGHCPMCKYDLRGEMEQGCSECGWNRES